MGFDLRANNGLPLTQLPSHLRTLEAAIADAVDRDITVVVSAGNGHISFPGMHPDVVSAGGVYVSADLDRRVSDYASAFESLIYPGRHCPDLSGLVGMAPDAAYVMLPLPPGCEIDRNGHAVDGTVRGETPSPP